MKFSGAFFQSGPSSYDVEVSFVEGDVGGFSAFKITSDLRVYEVLAETCRAVNEALKDLERKRKEKYEERVGKWYTLYKDVVYTVPKLDIPEDAKIEPGAVIPTLCLPKYDPQATVVAAMCGPNRCRKKPVCICGITAFGKVDNPECPECFPKKEPES